MLSPFFRSLQTAANHALYGEIQVGRYSCLMVDPVQVARSCREKRSTTLRWKTSWSCSASFIHLRSPSQVRACNISYAWELVITEITGYVVVLSRARRPIRARPQYVSGSEFCRKIKHTDDNSDRSTRSAPIMYIGWKLHKSTPSIKHFIPRLSESMYLVMLYTIRKRRTCSSRVGLLFFPISIFVNFHYYSGKMIFANISISLLTFEFFHNAIQLKEDDRRKMICSTKNYVVTKTFSKIQNKMVKDNGDLPHNTFRMAFLRLFS